MKTLSQFEKSCFHCTALALGILGDFKVSAQAAVEAWVQHFDGPGIVLVFGGDPEKMAVDSSGNVIVTGFGKIDGEFNHFYDGLVIKYSGAGVPLWTNRYQDRHFAMAVAVDDGGNIFLTADSATIKYSSAGIPLWTNYGAANAVAVDSGGNVVVTGNSYNIDGFVQTTIQYSGAGVPLWTNRYSGAGYQGERALAVAVNGSGDVFVTGNSLGTNGTMDYATIKYSPTGLPLWTNRYSGPDTGGLRTTPLAVDGRGNVFVAVTVNGANGNPPEYSAIKYSGTGVPLWTNRFVEPGTGSARATALAVDSGGNVFLTGSLYTNGTSQYATIGYSNGGVPLWTNIGPIGSWLGSADAIAVDGSGNVLVTGQSATIKYSSAGIPLWTNYGFGSTVAVDGSGTVFVTGSQSATIAYSSGGAPLWTNRYIESSSHGADLANSVALDNNGDVVVTGSSYGSSENTYATIKYSGAGVPIWTNRGPSGEAIAAVVDGSGNVVVTGNTYDGSSYEWATIKYSGAGVPLWTNRSRGLGYSDEKVALAVDGSGNVVVTGSSLGTNGYPDYATIKYSSAGVTLWTNRYRGAAYTGGSANAVAVDASGNVFVTGSSAKSGWNPYDYVTIKYSSAGVTLWTNRYNGLANYDWPEAGDDYPTAVMVDSSGNVVVTGNSHNGNDYDYATVKYSGAGVPLWTNRYSGSGNYDDLATALAVDSSGNVFVTGKSATTNLYPYYPDFATIKYSSAGVPLWTNRYNVPGGVEASATALCADRSGNVVVLGNLEFTNGSPDCATIKYSSSGVPLWTNRYHGGYATGLAVDSSGNVVVTGYSIGSDGSYDYLTIKYSPAGVPLLTIARTTTNTVALSWPAWASDALLQQASDLTSGNWTVVTNTPVVTNHLSQIILAPNRSTFYRLSR
jgi:uncharacterized delta-60 repeat protein